MKWISAKTPPTHDNEVLINRCTTRGLATEPVDFGRYNAILGCWRPRGCNGNWNDEVLYWMEKPIPPTADMVENQQADLAETEITILCKALEYIVNIPDNESGGDWDEIEEAREVAQKALDSISKTVVI